MTPYTRAAKKTRHRVAICSITAIVAVSAFVFLSFLLSYSVVEQYVICRYDFTPLNIEEKFEERYALFTENLLSTINIKDQNKDKEAIKTRNLESRIRKFTILHYDFSFNKPVYTVNVSAGYYTNGIETNPYNYSFTIALQRQGIFQYRITDVTLVDEPNHNHSNS